MYPIISNLFSLKFFLINAEIKIAIEIITIVTKKSSQNGLKECI